MKKILLFLTVLLTLAFQVVAQDLTVEATGYGINRNDAITNAKREALAQGIGQMLTSQTEVENFMVKRDQIITQTMGFVKTFQVLKESQSSDGAFEVRIRAQVGKDGLSKSLEGIRMQIQTVGNPRVALLITEVNVDGSNSAKAEGVLLDSLQARTFKMVDPNQALRFRESPDGVKALGGDPEAVARLGTKLNAEVLIIGTVVVKESDVSNLPGFAKSGMKSASATVTLKAFNVSTREIMAAKTTSQSSAHINVVTAGNDAIGKSIAFLLGPKGGFFDAMMEAWRKQANDGANYLLTIEGVPDFATVKTLKGALSSICSAVQQRGFNKPVLELEVTRTGVAADLAEALDGLKVGSQKLSIEGVQGNTLKASLK